MIDWITGLFSNRKVVERGVDLVDASVRGVGQWIDDWSFTESERSEAGSNLLKIRLNHIEKTLQENSQRSKARRDLARGFGFLFGVLILFSIIVFPFNAEWSIHIDKYIVLLQPIVGGLVGFYTLYYGVEQVFKRKKEE